MFLSFCLVRSSILYLEDITHVPECLPGLFLHSSLHHSQLVLAGVPDKAGDVQQVPNLK